MYANFYDKKTKCLYSIKINSEEDGYARANIEYENNPKVADYTITDKPISKNIKT